MAQKKNVKEQFDNLAEKIKYSPNKFSSEKSHVDDLLKTLQDDKMESIKQAITEIDNMVAERNELHQQLLDDLEKIKFLLNENRALVVQDPKLLIDLIEKQAEIEALIIQEKLNNWRDIALLKKEQREHLKEMREKESQQSMVEKLLE